MRASTAGLRNRGEASDARANQCFVGTATAEARSVGSGRSAGCAQRSRWRSSRDRGRSDLCSRHQHGRCGRFSCVSARPAPVSRGAVVTSRQRSIPLISGHLALELKISLRYNIFGRHGCLSAGAWLIGTDAPLRPLEFARRQFESPCGQSPPTRVVILLVTRIKLK